jgi:hypothetical protein
MAEGTKPKMWKCPKCGKVIISLYQRQLTFNKAAHLESHRRKRKALAKCVGLLVLGSVFLALTSARLCAAADYNEQSTTSSLTVSTVIDITLSHVPIAWGTLAPGTTNNLALSNQGNPATITVESTTNVLVDIYIKGTNWTSSSGTIGVDNCHYDTDSTPGGDNWATLSSSYPPGPNQGYFENVPPNTVLNTYWFIDIPAGQPAGEYTNTIYFKAVKDGTQP